MTTRRDLPHDPAIQPIAIFLAHERHAELIAAASHQRLVDSIAGRTRRRFRRRSA